MTTSLVVVAKFPVASVAVHVTIVVPRLNKFCETETTDDGSARSVAVAEVRVGVVVAPVASNVCVEGAVISGIVVSVMMTSLVVVEKFPVKSVEVQMTVVVPRPNDVGEAVTTGDESVSSVEVAEMRVGVVFTPVASNV